MNRLIRNNVLKLFSRFESDESKESKQSVDIELYEVGQELSNDPPTSMSRTYVQKSINGCKDIPEAVDFLNSQKFKEDLENVDETLLLKIHFEDSFENLRQNELQQFSKTCKNKSIVILFCSKNLTKFSICWKSKELQHFLTLFPYKDTPALVDKNFYEFLADRLATFISNGHLGISSIAFESISKGSNVELHLIADHRDFNMLLLAAESGRNDVLKLMLEQKLETELYKNRRHVKAQELAWNGKHSGVVLTLIKAGVTYPESFEVTKCSSELKEFCEKSEELHELIITEDVEGINNFLDQVENTHPFYNLKNESAAKIALDSKLIDIYRILVSHKIFLGRREVFHDSWKVFNESEREILWEIHFKYSIHMPEKHLHDLTNNSSVSHDDGNVKENLDLVKYAFGVLNQMALIKIILMIVAASKKLKILFDFKSDSVDVVDPTANSTMRGLFYTKGIICVGAGHLLNQATENETFGTLAHELCHYAMNLVYRNLAKPYKQNDRERRTEFSKIVKICEKNQDKEPLIALVFRYKRRLHHAELIVRVPHLITLYHNDQNKLKEVRENFIELFEYYEQKVVPDMERAMPKIEKEIERMDRKILVNKIIAIVTLILSTIIIIAGFFVTRSIFYKPVYKFDELPIVDQMRIENASVNYKGVEVKFYDLFSPNSSAYSELTSDHLTQMLDGQSLNFSDVHLTYLDKLIVHKWEKMVEKLQDKFLSSNLIFQNESVKLQNFHKNTSDAFLNLTSNQIITTFNGQHLNIGSMIQNRSEFYIERFFWNEDIFQIFYAYYTSIGQPELEDLKSEEKFRKFLDKFDSNKTPIFERLFEFIYNSEFNTFFRPMAAFKTFHEDFEKVVKKSENSKFFILSAEAGMGKTTTFEQFTIRIKRKYPMRWVSYIDLKDFTKLYNKNESIVDIVGFIEDILQISLRNLFERKIFERLYKIGSVVLLWNGFDEVSPKYSDFVIQILTTIHKNSSNIQFVCTRPLYSKLLGRKFNVKPQTLVFFDEETQTEFLKQFFMSKKIDQANIKGYVEKVFKIIQKSDVPSTFNTPLILEMIADLISKKTEIFTSENLYEIYLIFLTKKIEIWTESNFAKQFHAQSIVNNRKFDWIKMYQMYAFKGELIAPAYPTKTPFLNKKLKIMSQKVPADLTSEEISRMGILYINGETEFKFAHFTFGHFFIAQFFVENMFNYDVEHPENPELIIQLFTEITHQYGYIQFMVTNFLNSFTELQMEEFKYFNPKIVEALKTKFRRIIFEYLPFQKSRNFGFLMNFFKRDHKLLTHLLQIDQSETLYTASFNYINFPPAYTSKTPLNRSELRELGRNVLSDTEYEKFINGRNQKGIILWSLYLFHLDDMVINKGVRRVFHDEYDLDQEILKNQNATFVFVSIVKNLTKNEQKEIFMSQSSPLFWGQDDYIETKNCYEIAEALLTQDEQKTLISNFFYKISRSKYYKISIDFIIDKANKIMSDSEVYEVFFDRNLLHWASVISRKKTFEKMWIFFVNRTNEAQQKNILLHKVVGECFDLHFDDSIPHQKCYHFAPINIFFKLLATSGFDHYKDFNFFTEIYEKYLNKSEMQDMILNLDENLSYLILRGDICEEFTIYLRELFTGNETKLKQFILKKFNPSKSDDYQVSGTTPFTVVDNNLKYFETLLINITHVA